MSENESIEIEDNTKNSLSIPFIAFLVVVVITLSVGLGFLFGIIGVVSTGDFVTGALIGTVIGFIIGVVFSGFFARIYATMYT